MAMSSSPGMSDVSLVSPVTPSQAPVAPPVESLLKKVRVSTSDGRQVGGRLCGWMSAIFVPALTTELAHCKSHSLMHLLCINNLSWFNKRMHNFVKIIQRFEFGNVVVYYTPCLHYIDSQQRKQIAPKVNIFLHASYQVVVPG